MDDGVRTRIEAFAVLSIEERLEAVSTIAEDALQANATGQLSAGSLQLLRKALVEVVEADVGSGRERLPIGILLGRIGDPRIKMPSEPGYFVALTTDDDESFEIGRFEVTNFEYRKFVDDGGYTRRELWSDAGWAWLTTCEDPWHKVAASLTTDIHLVDNQPVVGVTFHEADAFARWAGCRLPWWYERVWAVRGDERRPYPWGSPFGEGNTNSKEEVLNRPCAVGLYVHDRTPEGVYDLAGNVGEWTAEQDARGEHLLHPGSWDQPSLAGWGKALTTEAPVARWRALGFRLAR